MYKLHVYGYVFVNYLFFLNDIYRLLYIFRFLSFVYLFCVFLLVVEYPDNGIYISIMYMHSHIPRILSYPILTPYPIISPYPIPLSYPILSHPIPPYPSYPPYPPILCYGVYKEVKTSRIRQIDVSRRSKARDVIPLSLVPLYSLIALSMIFN